MGNSAHEGLALAITLKETEMAADVQAIKMEDGRTVEFAGKRKMLKEIVIDGIQVGTRFDFSNGQTLMSWVPKHHAQYSAGHGWGQKLGDYVAGAKDDQGNPVDVDDMYLLVCELNDRLQTEGSEWRAVAEGTGVGGGSIIIKAMVEATSKTAAEIKAYLDAQIAGAEAKGQKLTRQALYSSLRAAAKLKPIIQRLEDEKAAKRKHLVSGDALLDGMAA